MGPKLCCSLESPRELKNNNNNNLRCPGRTQYLLPQNVWEWERGVSIFKGPLVITMGSKVPESLP